MSNCTKQVLQQTFRDESIGRRGVFGFFYCVIASLASLNVLIGSLEASPWIAIDTEADSLHAYPEKVCLIQISHAGGDELIDPLAKLDLNPLWVALQKRLLVFHGADYDLRMLRRGYGFIPNLVFDTMIAARLLGELQFGLSHLVEKFLGVQLEKGPQKMNWALRPLSERMEVYARNDTRHLRNLSNLLTDQLIAKGRLGWHQETCARLIRDCARPDVVDLEVHWRVKGTDRLERRAQAMVRELFYWREQEAIAANLPPYFTMSHELMTRVAEAADAGKDFESLLPTRYSSARRKGVENAISRALALPRSGWPIKRWQAGSSPSFTEQQRFEELKAIRDSVASEQGIDPTLIASKAMLSQLAQKGEESESGLLPWQAGLLLDTRSKGV